MQSPVSIHSTITWWYTPVIPVFWKLRQEDHKIHELETSLKYVVRSCLQASEPKSKGRLTLIPGKRQSSRWTEMGWRLHPDLHLLCQSVIHEKTEMPAPLSWSLHTVCVTGYHIVSCKYTQLLIQLKMLEGLEEKQGAGRSHSPGRWNRCSHQTPAPMNLSILIGFKWHFYSNLK